MSTLSNKKIIIYGNILTTVMTIIVNFLAVLLPLNGKTTQELSDSYPNLFVPAGYVFSIWSVIYVLMIAFIVYQWRNQDSDVIERISYYFILSNIANSAWIFLWHYEQVLLSVGVMFILLASLIVIYWKLEIGIRAVDQQVRYQVHLLFSVYLGWITIATVANITALLVSIGWDGFGIPENIWTVVVLIVATIIVGLNILTRQDIAYVLVPIWAFGGIVVKQLETNADVALVAGILVLVLAIFIAGKTYRLRRTATHS